MKLVDQIMTNKFQIPVELMMEHAGLNLAKLASREISSYNVVVFVGNGNNGGGGLVCARRLIAWGYQVSLYSPSLFQKFKETPYNQFKRTIAIDPGIHLLKSEEDFYNYKNESDHPLLAVDAYIGYGFSGIPSEIAKKTIQLIKSCDKIISLDAPSGLDTTTGQNTLNLIPDIIATLAYPKIGLLKISQLDTEIFLVDIGVPMSVYLDNLGLEWENSTKRELKKVYFKLKNTSFISIRLDNNGWTTK